MRRKRAVGRRPDLELAGREVSGPRIEVGRGVALPVPLVSVALGTELLIKPLARFALRVGTEILSRKAHGSRRQGAQQGNEDHHERARHEAGGHQCAASFARGFWPVKS
jgi:hypothetical protein